MKVAVLCSGIGTNLDAIRKAGIAVDLVLVDRDCAAWHKARRWRPQTAVERVDRARYGVPFEPHREAFTLDVMHCLDAYSIELVVMAGFYTVLAPCIFGRYRDRIINLHPSLLPEFPGPHAIRDTLAAVPRRKATGSTIHLATEAVDHGRILATTQVPIYSPDNETTLGQRMKEHEHKTFPAAIRGYMLELEQKTQRRRAAS